MPFSRNYAERRVPEVAQSLNSLLSIIARAEHGDRSATAFLAIKGEYVQERVTKLFEELVELSALRNIR